MENSMDRPSQAPEANQSPESELSSLPTLLQEQSTPSTMSPEQRLFRHITWLTLLLGIMIGIWLTLFGGLWYVSTGSIPNAFYPTSPIIYRLLGPLASAALGFVAILLRPRRVFSGVLEETGATGIKACDIGISPSELFTQEQ